MSKPKNLIDHPAKFTSDQIDNIAGILVEEFNIHEPRKRKLNILDPYAGVGTIFQLQDDFNLGLSVVAVEIEDEWASHDSRTIIGDSHIFMAGEWCGSNAFDAVVTSFVFPNRMCLTRNHLMLTADLKWIRAGDVTEETQLLAFDEEGQGVKSNGHVMRRKWQIANVIDSFPLRAECARVHLETGESITCTVDHPWLVKRARKGMTWVEAKDLIRYSDRPERVLRQLEPWTQKTSYEAGWLAGMYDGEGSLSFGLHGSPNLLLTQNEGFTADLIAQRLASLGYSATQYRRSRDRHSLIDFYIPGGFPETLKVLGELRPERLIKKLNDGFVENRTIQPWPVQVVAVEPVGIKTIQSIKTSTGTYIGEGFLMHNTDHHNAKDKSKRHTYKHYLGRDPSPESSATLGWGKEWKKFHREGFRLMQRVVRPNGLIILDSKNHFTDRGATEHFVNEWVIRTLNKMGMPLLQVRPVFARGLRHGKNYNERADRHLIIAMLNVK